MANVNAPFGLRPLRMSTGNQNIPLEQFTIAADNTTKIYYGDIVKETGTSQNVAKSDAGDATHIGVFCGCQYTDSSGKFHFRKNWDAPTSATDITCLIAADPTIVFLCQADTVAVTDIGAVADHANGTASDITGISGAYCDVGSGTATTAGGKSLRIVGLHKDPETVAGAYALVEVMFAEHARIAAGVGA